MNTILWILVFLGTFSTMEFMAWFTHKYVMHGFLWNLHRDHHHKDHNQIFYIDADILSMQLWQPSVAFKTKKESPLKFT